MTSVILYAASANNGSDELATLVSLRWGVVSLVDLYTGFTLFSLWIWFREASTVSAALWTVSMMTLGFAAGSAYVLKALREADGDWLHFWLGSRARAAVERSEALGRVGLPTGGE